MTAVRSFAALRGFARAAAPLRPVVAGGEATEVIVALATMLESGLIDGAVVTGDSEAMAPLMIPELHGAIEVVPASGVHECARAAVAAIRAGRGDVLMKGHVDSTSYLRAVVDRADGLRDGDVLSNVTVAEMPSLGRLIAATDNGILPMPTLEQKRQIVRNTTALFAGLGVRPVKVAAVCATEKASDAIPATRDAEALARGGLPGFEIGGPMGYDVAVSPEAARIKGLQDMPAAGAADLLLFPTIDAANAVAKAWKFHGQAETGSIVLGARVPVLLNSRSDSAARRVNALLLAGAMLRGRAAAGSGGAKRRAALEL
ncbi:phosphate acyltransferase [Ruegeria marina]|uniref:Phosphate butyryltransferase n=1 Tax=Ruegeria marina TaxID=639004 RepID=A0A1G6VN39_9RHOB|nr:phosphate acyltransferase [Ruegeria marina]SDD55022.1 phosphate butyryltransferase [Ruegeria marina]